MKVAIYVRVSSPSQVEEGYSLDAQIERCKAYAVSQDWEIAVIYVEEGESAKDLNRTEMKRMLSDAAEHVFDVLLVYRLDRLTRSVRDLHALLDLFEKNNIKFRSATEVYDTTTAMGRLFISIVASLAEWERANLGERVKFGKEQMAKEGNWSGGTVPFGFHWDKDKEILNIVPEEYITLRELRRLFMSGKGYRAVARSLNARNMLRRDGVLWEADVVTYTLENPLYAGKVRHLSKIYDSSKIPTIYSWEEYEEQIARMSKITNYGNSRKNEYWFVGILRCARCGSRMFGSNYANKRADGTKYKPVLTYMCSKRNRHRLCNMPMLRQSIVEEKIMTYLDGIKMKQEEIAASKEEITTNEIDRTSELEKLNKELKNIADRRRKWQYMFAEDMMNEVDFRARKREDDEQEKIILAAIDGIKASELGASLQVSNYIVDLVDLWKDLDDEQRKEWVQTIFDSVVFECDWVDGRKAHWKLPPPFRIVEVNFN